MVDNAASPGNSPGDTDLSGRQLGDYQLLRRLGRGGMADVYLAEQLSLRRQVAIKVLKTHLATDETFVKRFHLEALAAASLVHPNIVQILEVNRVNGIHYIAQEYVHGQNLREFLTREGPPKLKVALRVMRHVASALLRAAEKGIVHRDIKPENIMLARSGEVKLADFGLARLTREDDALNLTQVGQTMGTPLYMSPEQVEGKPLDPRSDLYSLGVTCYHMLAGEPPFRGDTAIQIALQHLNAKPERLEHIRPDLPLGVCRIVHRLLEKSPDQRQLSARELLRDLKKIRIDDEDDLDEGFDVEDAAEFVATPEGRSAATQQLDTIMKSSLRKERPRDWRWLWAPAALTAFALGGWYAWQNRPQSLLESAAAMPSTVKKQATAEAQYAVALALQREDAWEAVIHYWPENNYFRLLAEKELALIHMSRPGEEAKALATFSKLSNLGDMNIELRATGLAGEALVLALLKRHEESSRKLAELRSSVLPNGQPLSSKLDRQMQDLVEFAMQANAKALNRQDNAQLLEQFKDRLLEEPDGNDSR